MVWFFRICFHFIAIHGVAGFEEQEMRPFEEERRLSEESRRLDWVVCVDQADQRLDYMLELQHEMTEAGHAAFYADRTQFDLGMDVERIAKLVERSEVDAWVVCSGSREVLEWFAMQSTPVMALFGNGKGMPIARVGPDKVPAYAAATRRLIELGHRRIVLLARSQRLQPKPGPPEQAFLDELAAHGLPTGAYNVPIWTESMEGFHQIVEELFRITPPTALIVDEPFLFLPVQQHLARRGILAPEHVSLVCTDPEERFGWCEPSVAHMRWDSGPVVRRVVRWAANVARGKEDRCQTVTKAEFVESGTIGPVGEG